MMKSLLVLSLSLVAMNAFAASGTSQAKVNKAAIDGYLNSMEFKIPQGSHVDGKPQLIKIADDNDAHDAIDTYLVVQPLQDEETGALSSVAGRVTVEYNTGEDRGVKLLGVKAINLRLDE